VFLPDIHPHFFAGEDGGDAYCIQVDVDELSDGLAELIHGEVFQFLSLLYYYFVGNVLHLIIT